MNANTNVYNGGAYITSQKEWDIYRAYHHLDSSLPYNITVKGGTAYFNKELSEELSLVVYGD